MNKSFFMVYVDGMATPKIEYSDMVNAESEAKRLAKLTGKAAFVLCSIKSFKIEEFIIEDCRPQGDDLPF